jgi:hypothetical protein
MRKGAEFTTEERARRYLRLAQAAAAQGRERHARVFRQLAADLDAPAGEER